MPLVALGVIGAVGSIAGGAMSASAAGDAADTQANAANRAAELQAQTAAQSLDFQKQMWGQTQQNFAPYLSAGTGALGTIGQMTTPGSGYDFTSDPSYQFRLNQGQDSLTRGRAMAGVLNTGGTGKALIDYGQGAASQEWGNEFNRLMGVAGLGQSSAAGQAAAGQNYAGQYTNTQMNSANNIGNLWTQGANATAAGQVGSANAWGQAFSGAGNSISQYLMLKDMMKKGQPVWNNPGGMYEQGQGTGW